MALTLAFIMDPLEAVRVDVDTSFAFMLAAHRRGHRVVHVSPRDVSVAGDQVLLHGWHVEVQDEQGEHYRGVERLVLPARSCAAIFIRTDPPFDQDYLTVTWLLSLAEKQGVRFINSPSGLRAANEHLFALHFVDLCPATLISSSRDEILAFVAAQGGDTIAKPIDGHGGYGVVRLRRKDSNAKALIELLTSAGKRQIMVQQFIDDPAGDKRLILIDGALRGAVRRVPAADDHRGNVHVGGRAEAVEIEASDRAIEAALGPRLRELGLFFVGLDVLGGKLIEVNVTSPTLIRELKRLGGPDLAEEVIDAIETGEAARRP